MWKFSMLANWKNCLTARYLYRVVQISKFLFSNKLAVDVLTITSGSFRNNLLFRLFELITPVEPLIIFIS